LSQQRQIVLEYGAVLDAASRIEGMALDAGQLPHPKETIRQAVLALLQASTKPEQSQLLNVMLLRLADFQHGVGGAPVALNDTGPQGKVWRDRVEEERRGLASDLLAQTYAPASEPGTNTGRLDQLLPSTANLPQQERESMVSALEDADRTLAGGTSRSDRSRLAMAEALQRADLSLSSHAERVLTEYGQVLRAHSPFENAIVLDTDLLPHPKPAIGAAIVKSLSESDDPSEQEFLKSAFVKLADFQEGVGSDPVPSTSAPWSERLAEERQALATALSDAGYPLGDDAAADAERVLMAYGKTLQELETPEDWGAVDVSQLPHPKPVIHDAILRLLESSDDPQDHPFLQVAFLRLAHFQDGVGANPVAMEAEDSDGAAWGERVEGEKVTRTEALAAAGHPFEPDAPE
jgi:hypothetical protein